MSGHPYDEMPEPPPPESDPFEPPHPDDAYFMALDDPWMPPEPPDFADLPPDPWIPDDERWMPPALDQLPDVPPLAQDGLQGFETPEPVESGWSWHDTQLIGVERTTEDSTQYEIGCLDLYSNANTGEIGGHYLPMVAFSDREVASAFYQDVNAEIEAQGLAVYEVRDFAQDKTVALNEEPQAWREAGAEEYTAYAYVQDLTALAGRDEPPELAYDALEKTLAELGGVSVPLESEQPSIGGPTAFEALSAIGLEADGFDPTRDPPPFYDANTGTAYWIGVFQPDKEDRENCVTSILSLGRNPETGEMEAQLAPCVPGEWDKAYNAAEYLIQVAQKGGIDRCFDAAEGMALATDQRALWENDRGVALEPEAARDIADYTREAWEMDL